MASSGSTQGTSASAVWSGSTRRRPAAMRRTRSAWAVQKAHAPSYSTSGSPGAAAASSAGVGGRGLGVLAPGVDARGGAGVFTPSA
jgi:hypothetical protein